jgi:hypothetical protein
LTYQVEIDEVAVDVAVLYELRHSRQLLRTAAAKLDSEDIFRVVTLN